MGVFGAHVVLLFPQRLAPSRATIQVGNIMQPKEEDAHTQGYAGLEPNHIHGTIPNILPLWHACI